MYDNGQQFVYTPFVSTVVFVQIVPTFRFDRSSCMLVETVPDVFRFFRSCNEMTGLSWGLQKMREARFDPSAGPKNSPSSLVATTWLHWLSVCPCSFS